MTDQELLEAAAKAAGMGDYAYCVPWRGMARTNGLGEFFGPTWNPLTDDRDAFRLAVKMRLDIGYDPAGDLVCCQYGTDNYSARCERLLGDDLSAIRRAIVRVAADVGKTL